MLFNITPFICTVPSFGLVIEHINLSEYQSGFKTLEMIGLIKGLVTSDDIHESLRRVGLDPTDKKPVHKYSLGMKQKLALAQAIMEKPDIILLDEPTNSLDDESVEDFYNLIREEKERGATIVITSHYAQDLELLADVQYEMNKGVLKRKENIHATKTIKE